MELVAGPTPHDPHEVMDETHTDERGRFRFEHRYEGGAIVVRQGEMARTYRPEPGEDDLVVRLAPTREQTFRIRCTAEMDEEDGRYLGFVRQLLLTWDWPRDERRPTDVWFPPGESFPPMATRRSAPGREDWRVFEIGIPLPEGAHELAIAGPCGAAARPLTVLASEGDLPDIELTLPAEDSGSIELRDEAPGQVYIELRGMRLNDGAPRWSRIERLAPGRYELRSRVCRRSVDVVPGGNTRVTVRADGCDVRVPS